MDFSSIPRVLESLPRRHPPLPEETREQALALLEGRADHPLQTVLQWMTTTVQTGDKVRWEPLAVSLYMAEQWLQSLVVEKKKSLSDTTADTTAVATVYMEGPRVPAAVVAAQPAHPAAIAPADFLEPLIPVLHQACLQHLEDPEPRVRTLVAKALGAYCQVTAYLHSDNPVYADMRKTVHDTLVQSIQDHLQKGRQEAEQAAAQDRTTSTNTETSDAAAVTTGTTEAPRYSRDSTGALDDTTGWRGLETQWQGLAAVIHALQARYFTDFELTPDLLQAAEHSCVVHVNRHVRAAALQVLEQWIHAASASTTSSALLDPVNSPLMQTCKTALKAGLADNWSQVRMAASVLCRVVFLALLKHDDISLEPLHKVLLPRMCLNRFYLAQGVKLYSHETWKLVFTQGGVAVVAEHLSAVCRYYVKMCDADNHVVREAACQAIAELAVRFGEEPELRTALEPHVELLLQALLMCFHDESWPVRDQACLACGTLCKGFPEECRPSLPVLWERWTEQLTDQIWSVRQDAATALGDAVTAYPEKWADLQTLVKKLLPAAKEQPAMTRAEYKAHIQNVEMHENAQLYSCGSLAPKLRKQGAGRIGGCSSCGIDRPKAPWEATDGCIYLITSLLQVIDENKETVPATVQSDDYWVSVLSELADVCRVSHFPQADDLRATLWRNLPFMAQALGKQRFKRLYLDLFLDLMLRNLDGRRLGASTPLCQHAAAACAAELAQFIGSSLFCARLEPDQLQAYQWACQERSRQPPGPTVFSPFGPPGLVS